MYSYFPSDLTAGINAIVEQKDELLKTFATVVTVKQEGLYVDVKLDLYSIGNTVLNNIPVLKNPYLNLPIRPGDKVFLTTSSHLLNDYFTMQTFIKYVANEAYVAIPVLLQPFQLKQQFKNHYTYVNPELTYREIIDESTHKIEAETINETIKLNSSEQEFINTYKVKAQSATVEAATTINVKCENASLEASSSVNVNAQSSARIESQAISAKAAGNLTLTGAQIDLGSEAVKIGALIGQIIDALTSSTTTTVGGPSTQAGPTLDGGAISRLQSVKAQLTSVFR